MAQPDWIALYLQEDLDDVGDITSDTLFAPDLPGRARVVAREPCFLAGSVVAGEVFSRCGAASELQMNDGSWIDAGAVVMEVSGPTGAILRAERLALNVLARMSGVATQARTLVERLAAAGSDARIAATRKTTPGFRAFEKEAIRIAGGDPHRMGLYDAAMIKDNHIAAAGDIAGAVRAVKQAHPEAVLTMEVESLEDALAAASAGTDWVLIDNQDPTTGQAWAKALRKEHPGVRVEASGGIAAASAEAYGWADRISLGALTTRARSIDFGLDWGQAS